MTIKNEKSIYTGNVGHKTERKQTKHEDTKKLWVKPGAREWKSVSVSYIKPAVLLL